MTQSERILKYINDFGSITPMQAFGDLGITKLATRISEMRSDVVNACRNVASDRKSAYLSRPMKSSPRSMLRSSVT